MNLLFTGSSGFLGKHTIPLLERTYSIKTLGLSDADDYNVSLADQIPKLKERFDVVLHAAGKAHSIPKTEVEKKAFFDVNLQGTKNLCAALEITGVPESFIFISSVAVYGIDSGENISEDYPLNGDTAYALSKIRAEEYLAQWCKEHQVILSILRPSLIAGPHAPGNLGDMVKAIKSGRYISISGSKARKSILMVEDIANLVPLLIEKGGIYNVCDTQHPTFREIEKIITTQLGKRMPVVVPYHIVKLLALLGDLIGEGFPVNSIKLNKITQTLTFSSQKAIDDLNWKPLNVIDNYVIE